ncbi:MAG: tetratricopeptide repeat protein [Ignavibacteriales bacterium]|nr:tetratricopeptide repeat protein [Ignavibacteriales bacterium]
MILHFGKIASAAVLLSFVIATTSLAQNAKVDSLKAQLPGETGTPRIAILSELIDELETLDARACVQYSQEGLQLSEAANEKEYAAKFSVAIGYSLCEMGEYPEALRFATRGLEMFTQLNDRRGMADAYSTLGITYVYTAQYSKALENHLEALRLREDLGLKSLAMRTMNNIGTAYHKIGQYERAIEYYAKVLEYRREMKDTLRIIRVLNNIGYAETKMNRYDAALKLHTEALRLSEVSRSTSGYAYTLYNLGIVYTGKKEYQKAHTYLNRSHALYTQLSQKYGVLESLNALGAVCFALGDEAGGIRRMQEAASLARQVHALEPLLDSYEMLSNFYERNGNRSLALHYFKEYESVKDTIFSSVEANRIAELSIRFEAMKREREIESLRNENRISELGIEKQRSQMNFLMLGAGVLIALIAGLFQIMRVVRRRRAEVERKNVEYESLNQALQEKVGEIKTLGNLLPICAQCKKIRNDKGYWEQLEGYLTIHSQATISHGMCPECAQRLLHNEE